MKIKNFYICAALFVALTGVKFAFPEHSGRIRAQLLAVIEGDDDYASMVSTMGEKLYSGELKDELLQAFAKTEERVKQHALEAIETSPETDPLHDDENSAQSEEKLPEDVMADQPELPFDYCCPVMGQNSSGFGYREHPIDGVVKFHYGTDFAAETGESVHAFASGYVFAAGSNDSYGNYLILEHEGGCRSLYAHLSAFEIKEGDAVEKGQMIGRVGQSGNATGPHLHFELTIDGMYLDPEYYV